MKKAFITGITGQDGSYLAELLLSKGYEVHGLMRRASTFNTHRIDHLYRDPHLPDTRLFLHYGDLSDSSLLTNIIYSVQPEEIYHLGAQSHVLCMASSNGFPRGASARICSSIAFTWGRRSSAK